MPDDVLTLAYDSALNALREQDSTISNLRNRATGLLAAAAVGTSFTTALGLLNTDPDRGAIFPPWAGWTVVGLVALIGISVMVVLWPAPKWIFGPDPAKLLENAGKDIDDVRRIATRALLLGITANNRSIALRVTAYRLSAGLLLTESIVLILALLTSRQ
ncbi:MAG: hypothetical protein ACT4NY_27065 [Pseudonocardiales bacterium]